MAIQQAPVRARRIILFTLRASALDIQKKSTFFLKSILNNKENGKQSIIISGPNMGTYKQTKGEQKQLEL